MQFHSEKKPNRVFDLLGKKVEPVIYYIACTSTSFFFPKDKPTVLAYSLTILKLWPLYVTNMLVRYKRDWVHCKIAFQSLYRSSMHPSLASYQTRKSSQIVFSKITVTFSKNIYASPPSLPHMNYGIWRWIWFVRVTEEHRLFTFSQPFSPVSVWKVHWGQVKHDNHIT
jgi:hypothetical protein